MAEIAVEVVYALPGTQRLVALRLPAGSTALDAIRASGLLEAFPEIDPATQAIGIFARACKPDAVLRDGDRVEIYRPLIADPKEVRRQRVAAGKSMKKGEA